MLIDGTPHLLLASNNYLGLANDPRVMAGARAALDAYGAGAGASRLVTGSLDLHRRLEERIAALKRTEDALVFPTGFQANVGTIPALVGPGDQVFSDELNHASIIDGCRLARAEVVRYRHADAGALEDRAARGPAGPPPAGGDRHRVQHGRRPGAAARHRRAGRAPRRDDHGRRGARDRRPRAPRAPAPWSTSASRGGWRW